MKARKIKARVTKTGFMGSASRVHKPRKGKGSFRRKKGVDIFACFDTITDMEEIQKQLTMVLFMQTVASARNVKADKKYMALAMDVARVIEGKDPKHSKELI